MESRRVRLKALCEAGEEIGPKDWENPGPEFWTNSLVPFFAPPLNVESHVDIEAWRVLSDRIDKERKPGWERKLELATAVLSQLKNGVSSGVRGAGLEPINMPNFFEDLEVDPPRVLDALLKGIKNRTIAGPLSPSPQRCRRINALLSVPKPGGERRQVGDLSSPGESEFSPDKSFNNNVDRALETCWPLTQLTAKQFALMIKSMGVGAIMAKTDLSQAYKCLPVELDQRKLQRFRFGGMIFEELRLVFGDTYAPMFFDRFHTVILTVFVSEFNGIPRCIWEKCIDDVPVVVPESRIEWLRKHVYHYREVCDELNIKLSPMDNASKGFEALQVGEVLGVIFNTVDMTWKLPERKRNTLIALLRQVVFEHKAWTMNEWEKLRGKLTDFYQLWPAGKFFIDSFLKQEQLAETKALTKPVRAVIRDAKVWLSVLEGAELPIPTSIVGPPPMHFRTFSDASGEFLDTPSIGILVPAQFGLGPRVASWQFPRGFLDSVDEKGCKCFRKTTCLEALGILCTLLLASDLLGGQSVVHVVDNIASCLAWKRRRSTMDRWATTLVKATGHVCAYLSIDLHTEWQLRRSDRFTVAVDDLSHDLCQSLTSEEMKSYISEPCVGFPDPILKWMEDPREDLNLGIHLVDWLRRRHANM